MPGQFLSLEPNEAPRLKLEWGGYMREFKVSLDDVLLSEIEGGQRALKKGHQVTLPDGSLIDIQLKQSMLLDSLHVSRDGVPLFGTAGHPAQKVGVAVRGAFYWGLLEIAAAIFLALSNSAWLQRWAFTWPLSLGLGIVLVVHAVLIQKRQLWAAFAALISFSLVSIVSYQNNSALGYSPATLSIMARVFIFALLAQSIPAIAKYRALLAGTNA